MAHISAGLEQIGAAGAGLATELPTSLMLQAANAAGAPPPIKSATSELDANKSKRSRSCLTLGDRRRFAIPNPIRNPVPHSLPVSDRSG